MTGGYTTKQGFALPTILIASVIMLTVLISAVTATSSVRTALDSQYYTQLAREAAEAGIARANACLQDNSYSAQWSSSNPLRPNTSCSGGAECTDNPSCFVMSRGNIRTTFRVGAPLNQTVAQLVQAEGKVELVRSSNNAVWRSYTFSTSARVGISLGFDTVAFSYAGGYGAHFATIGADGIIRAAGYNGWGQLGNGSYSATLTPREFRLNGTDRGVALYTNFVSQGYQMLALTDKGDIYGAGWNGNGQLGDGTTSTRNIPVRYNLPSGTKGKFAALNGFATFVLADNHNIYASGSCGSGRLGTNYTITDCSDQLSPQRVALPTPSTTALRPTNNIVTDYFGAFARLQGGRVYGWGYGGSGVFGNGSTASSSVPVKIGTFGDSGLPQATQVAFDGVTVWILDSTGKVYTAGRNDYGQTAAKGLTLRNDSTGTCLASTDGTAITFQSCTSTTASVVAARELTFRTVNNSIYHENSGKCLENTSGDGVNLRLATCSTSVTRQRFVLRDDGTLYNATVNKCVASTSSTAAALANCSTAAAQKFTLPDVRNLKEVSLPTAPGRVIKIATDQWYVAFLMENGEVWSAGINACGQLGNGATAQHQPFPVKFNLPSGITATDIFVGAYNPASTCEYSNIFAVGSNGRVYGAGSNTFGQLGDGTTTQRSTPVVMQVINGTTIRAQQLMSGYGTTVVLTTNNKVYTVGNNSHGQLGDGTTSNSSTPKANQYTNVLPITVF